jgi:large subunit ribosomal protein L21
MGAATGDSPEKGKSPQKREVPWTGLTMSRLSLSLSSCRQITVKLCTKSLFHTSAVTTATSTISKSPKSPNYHCIGPHEYFRLLSTAPAASNNGENAKKSPCLSLTYHPYSLSDSETTSASSSSSSSLSLSSNSPSPREDRFAVVELSGTQYKVTLDDVIMADLIPNVDIGDKVDLDKVLLVGTKKATAVGRPYVQEAKVIAAVEEITKDKKVIAFKTRRRKNSKSTRGFRRQLTILRVVDIQVEDSIATDL